LWADTIPVYWLTDATEGYDEDQVPYRWAALNWMIPFFAILTYFDGDNPLPILTTIESIIFFPGNKTKRVQIPCS